MSALSQLIGSLTRSLRANRIPLATCPVCGAKAPLLDTVDLNKTCEEARGVHLPPSGIDVQYYLCADCSFCFAPALQAWSMNEFEERIYNDGYAAIDPDYERVRPEGNARMLHQVFGQAPPTHLDFGGGSGLMSRLLQAKGWDSRSYDPFVDRTVKASDLGTFDLVTAFEVFEHVPDVDALVVGIKALLKPGGLVFFSTLLSDGEIGMGRPLTWWYASPRNGHISLFSAESLRRLLEDQGLNLRSLSANLHLACESSTLPSWASRLVR